MAMTEARCRCGCARFRVQEHELSDGARVRIQYICCRCGRLFHEDRARVSKLAGRLVRLPVKSS